MQNLTVEILSPKAKKYRALVRNKAARLLDLARRNKDLAGKKALDGLPALEVYLVDEKFMEKNVLAFEAPKDFARPDLSGATALGEIYLNPFFIEKEGEDLIFMLIHGFLHLLGYDHKRKSDRIEMEAKERELLERLAKR